MLLMCVTGKQGTGKTTFVQSHRYYVLPGRVCREKVGAGAMSGMENPSCPNETEKIVREAITSAIGQTPTNETLWIDGFPRNVGQAEWLKSLNTPIQVLVLTCEREERLRRLRIRDVMNEADTLLVNKRENTESSMLLDMLCELQGLGIPWVGVDTTNVNPEEKRPDLLLHVHQKTDMVEVFRLHRELLAIGGAKFPPEEYDTEDSVIAGTDRARTITNMLKHIKMECDEALDLIPDKCWPIPDLKTPLSKLRVELIDVFHFVLSSAMSLGMDAHKFTQLYFSKRNINIRRQTEGYLKTKLSESGQ